MPRMPQKLQPSSSSTDGCGRLSELHTIRDWLRYSVSRFNAAGLAYGHGTDCALDEAAFLILATLHLDLDRLEPWLDARLTTAERAQLDAVIEARIATRKPAPYLVGIACIRGRRFVVDERTIVPRSFIGELICDYMDDGAPDFPPLTLAEPPVRILDLCTGGGSLAILAALAFPEAQVDAADLSATALEVARTNVAAFGLETRIRIVESDLFAVLGDARYDLIISNPPYVTDAAVAAFPPEHQAEPVLAHRGGPDGLTLVRRILESAGAHLAPNGQLIVEIGAAQPALVAAYPALPFVWLDTAISSGEVFALPAADLQGGSKRAVSRRSRG